MTDLKITKQTAQQVRQDIDRELLIAIGKKVLGDQIEWYETQYKHIDIWEKKKTDDWELEQIENRLKDK